MNDFCPACDMPHEDWTPGCKTCRERHRARARRSGDPRRLAEYHRLARESFWRAIQDTARRIRDREIVRPDVPRDSKGRWTVAR